MLEDSNENNQIKGNGTLDSSIARLLEHYSSPRKEKFMLGPKTINVRLAKVIAMAAEAVAGAFDATHNAQVQNVEELAKTIAPDIATQVMDWFYAGNGKQRTKDEAVDVVLEFTSPDLLLRFTITVNGTFRCQNIRVQGKWLHDNSSEWRYTS